VSALANKDVGKYVNEYFCSSFQKVATFRIVNGAKQGGNVASYFCAPDGRVLHVVAGPVDADTFLREAKWAVETAKAAVKDSKGDGAKFKQYLRKAHADKLRAETGLVVEPATFDYEPPGDNDALTYRDPTGRPLVAKLPPPPIDGPDVSLRHLQEAAAKASDAALPGRAEILDRKGGRWVLGNQGRADQLLASHGMTKIELLYGSVFENILGEKISTRPVEIVNPFPWKTDGKPALRAADRQRE
jgi:hypothetical protein